MGKTTVKLTNAYYGLVLYVKDNEYVIMDDYNKLNE